MQITLNGFKPYDGTYPMDVRLNTREEGWVKRFAGYLPPEYDKAGGDSEFATTLVVIALHRAGRIDKNEAAGVFERLLDVRLEQVAKFDFDDEIEAEEDDAGPPALSSNGSETTSGADSPTSSETSAQIPSDSGTPVWAISQSGPPTSET